MDDSLFSVDLPQNRVENFLGECVFLQLEWGNRIDEKEIDLIFLINFNEHKLDLQKKGWYVLGITAGNLCLQIVNGEIPFDKRCYWQEFIPRIISKRKTITKMKSGEGVKGKLEVEFGIEKGLPKATITPSVEGSINTEDAIEIQDDYVEWIERINTTGDPKNPKWLFKKKAADVLLTGGLKKQLLGIVTLIDLPCKIRVVFEVYDKDYVIINYGGGDFFQKLSINKQKAAVNRVRKYLAEEYKNIFCEGQLIYGE